MAIHPYSDLLCSPRVSTQEVTEAECLGLFGLLQQKHRAWGTYVTSIYF